MKKFTKYPKAYVSSATNAVFGIAVYFEDNLLGYVGRVSSTFGGGYEVEVNEDPAAASHYLGEAEAQKRMKYVMSRCRVIKVDPEHYSVEAPRVYYDKSVDQDNTTSDTKYSPAHIYKWDHRISMKVAPIVELPASGASDSDEAGKWVIAMYVSGELKGYVYSDPVGAMNTSRYSGSWLNVVPDTAEAKIYEDPSEVFRALNRYKNFHCIRVYNDVPPTWGTYFETWARNVDVDNTESDIFKIDSRVEFKIESLDNNGESITFM